MGLRLSLGPDSETPKWVDMGDGVGFLMRPATTPEYRAAEAAASERLRQAILGAETLADLGLEAPSADEIADESMMLGYSRALMGVELAIRIVSHWRGVWVDEEEAPAELTPRNMAGYLRDPSRHQRFESEAYRRIGEVFDEGKG